VTSLNCLMASVRGPARRDKAKQETAWRNQPWWPGRAPRGDARWCRGARWQISHEVSSTTPPSSVPGWERGFENSLSRRDIRSKPKASALGSRSINGSVPEGRLKDPIRHSRPSLRDGDLLQRRIPTLKRWPKLAESLRDTETMTFPSEAAGIRPDCLAEQRVWRQGLALKGVVTPAHVARRQNPTMFVSRKWVTAGDHPASGSGTGRAGPRDGAAKASSSASEPNKASQPGGYPLACAVASTAASAADRSAPGLTRSLTHSEKDLCSRRADSSTALARSSSSCIVSVATKGTSPILSQDPTPEPIRRWAISRTSHSVG